VIVIAFSSYSFIAILPFNTPYAKMLQDNYLISSESIIQNRQKDIVRFASIYHPIDDSNEEDIKSLLHPLTLVDNKTL
jgi:hypothetical protein